MPPPIRESGGASRAAIVIACVFLVVALVTATAFTVLYMTKGTPAQPGNQVSATPTTAPTPVPTPSPTPVPTPSPTPVPTATPLPAADAGFVWCSPVCNQDYGFLTEYPGTWQPGAAVNSTGIQFVNPDVADQFAVFKTPGPTTSTAGDLLATDLQTNYATRVGYTAPTGTTAATIGGETWVVAIAYYASTTDPTQRERVVVYATVHQGKAFMIELQALDTQFDVVNQQIFAVMLGRFQFAESATGPTAAPTAPTSPTSTPSP